MATISQSLFGIDWITKFDLWKERPTDYCIKICATENTVDSAKVISDVRKEFANVFSDSLGCCSITLAKLNLRNNVPIFRPKRDVPFASRGKVEEELNRLEKMGIITPVTFSPYAAPIVVVHKPNGKIRICADYSSGLNDSLSTRISYPDS